MVQEQCSSRYTTVFLNQVVPPTFRELPPPTLDLFDLDEHFSSEQARIAQLTNKCMCVGGRGLWLWGVSASRVLTLLLGAAGGDEDLEYYVRECGSILGVHQKLPEDANSGKHILEYILHHVVEFKKFNQVCGEGCACRGANLTGACSLYRYHLVRKGAWLPLQFKKTRNIPS